MKINILKFGPIENAAIEFSPMLIFTGDSNLGKSYVNYLMYYVVSSLTDLVEISSFINQKKKNNEDFEISIDSVEKWLESRIVPFMRTFLGNPDLEDSDCKVQFVLAPPENFKMKFVKFEFNKESSSEDESVNENGKFTQLSLSINGVEYTDSYPSGMFDRYEEYFISLYFSSVLQKKIFDRILYSAFILPPARGAFVGENYTMKDKISSQVGMYRLFLKDYDKATQKPFSYKSRERKNIEKYTTEIGKLIKGNLISEDGKQYYKLPNGKPIPLSAAASSIKELSPFLFSLQADPSTDRSFCIEEPEAHLHPQMQIGVTDLIALCLSDGMMFQMTTHSDYVLQRINQLVKLYYIKNNDKSQFQKICAEYGLSENHCINPDKIGMYYFSLNEEGKAKVERLKFFEVGVPMVTFFEVVRSMEDIEDSLNDAIELINEKKNDDHK